MSLSAPTALRLALVCLIAAAAACAPTNKRILGALVYDGMPRIPDDARARPYFESRYTGLFDWAPNGEGVLIGTRFAESSQLHHVRAPVGARRQLTFAREPVTAAATWHGKPGIVFRKDVGGNEAWQYFWLDPADGVPRLVTDGASRNDGLLVHPSLPKALFTSTKRNGRDADVYVMEGDTPVAGRLVAEVKGRIYPQDWNKDGTRALVMRYVSITNTHLYVLDVTTGKMTPVDGSGDGREVARLHARFDRTSDDHVYMTTNETGEFAQLMRLQLSTGKKERVGPALPWGVERIAVSPDGRTLAYGLNEGGASTLFVTPAASTDAPRRIDLPLGIVRNLKFDQSGQRLAFMHSGPQSPSDVYSIEVATGALTRWTDSEVGGLDPKQFPKPKLIQYKSFDGRMIPSWFYPAPGAAPGTKTPVVIIIHGGPESQATAYFNPMHALLGRELGVAVLVPNVRGSSGYGKTYVRLDNAEKREDSVKDIGALFDWIATRPELDAARVGVYGGSYGGYMVLATMMHYSDRLRCGIEFVGISNFVTFLKNTKAYRRDLRRVEYGDERDPKMRALLEQISPTNNVHRIAKPLFVVQGANDPRVPESEAEQIVRGVRKQGRDVWYLLAKNEGHGFKRKTNIAAFVNAFLAFFRTHLLK